MEGGGGVRVKTPLSLSTSTKPSPPADEVREALRTQGCGSGRPRGPQENHILSYWFDKGLAAMRDTSGGLKEGT